LLILWVQYIFEDNLTTLITNLCKVVPTQIKIVSQELIAPILNFLFFVGFVGLVLLIIISLMAGLKEKKGWFKTFFYNYSYFFWNGKGGLFDKLAEKLIALPVNFGIIISGLCYLLDCRYSNAF
jgi:hypothetical protein